MSLVIKEITALAKLIIKSDNTIILTGAGMDTESNIPDFRSKSGWWKNVDPMTLASINALKNNYNLFYEFYKERIKLLEQVEPHKGHLALKELEDMGFVDAIITQNVSNLHSLAGNKNIYEVHGNIREIYCKNCHSIASVKQFLAGPSCIKCKTNSLRPNVVLFGESLPKNALDFAIESISQSDLLIVIGTSLSVHPINQLPLLATGKVVYINLEPADQTYNFYLTIEGTAGDVLTSLVHKVKQHI